MANTKRRLRLSKITHVLLALFLVSQMAGTPHGLDYASPGCAGCYHPQNTTPLRRGLGRLAKRGGRDRGARVDVARAVARALARQWPL